MLPVAESSRRGGVLVLEMWGGATFGSAMRFTKENPQDRGRALPELGASPPRRSTCCCVARTWATPLLHRRHRGKFVEAGRRAGIEVFRVFDALNDPRTPNMEWAMRCVKKEVQRARPRRPSAARMISPVHNNWTFVKGALELKEMGADSICTSRTWPRSSPLMSPTTWSRRSRPEWACRCTCTRTTPVAALATLVKSAEAGADIVSATISSLPAARA